MYPVFGFTYEQIPSVIFVDFILQAITHAQMPRLPCHVEKAGLPRPHTYAVSVAFAAMPEAPFNLRQYRRQYVSSFDSRERQVSETRMDTKAASKAKHWHPRRCSEAERCRAQLHLLAEQLHRRRQLRRWHLHRIHAIIWVRLHTQDEGYSNTHRGGQRSRQK